MYTHHLVHPLKKDKQLSTCQQKADTPTRRKICSEAGTTTIEFAFAIGLVFLLTFGLADLGRLVYTASVVRAAAQEGARTGIVDITEIAPAIVEKMVGLNGDQAQIDVSQPDQDSVAVGVTYEYHFMVPLIAMATGQDSIKLHSSASMIIR